MLNNITFFQILLCVFFMRSILDSRKSERLRLTEVLVSRCKECMRSSSSSAFPSRQPVSVSPVQDRRYILQLSEGILAPWRSVLFICNRAKCTVLRVPCIVPFPCSFRANHIYV